LPSGAASIGYVSIQAIRYRHAARGISVIRHSVYGISYTI